MTCITIGYPIHPALEFAPPAPAREHTNRTRAMVRHRLDIEGLKQQIEGVQQQVVELLQQMGGKMGQLDGLRHQMGGLLQQMGELRR